MSTIELKSTQDPLLAISNLIRKRKTTYASAYIDKKIPKGILERIVTNALWAPTHKLTQPWRFVVLEGKHQQALGDFMLAYYKEKYTETQFPVSRYETTRTYAQNATMIAIVFQRNTRADLEEWEEIAAISCAVQNMWLSCTAMDLGCYWDTAPATIAYGNACLTLEANEKCLGVFYMGYQASHTKKTHRKRKPLSKKLTWNYLK